MKEQFYRVIAIFAFVGVIASIGGLEQGMFGYGGYFLRTGFFMGVMLVASWLAENEYIKEGKRSERK